MSFINWAIFLTKDDPEPVVLDCSSDSNELLDPADGLRGGCKVDSRRVGSIRLQLFGTLTAQRLW